MIKINWRVTAIAIAAAFFASAQVRADSGSGYYMGIAGGISELGVDKRQFAQNTIAYKGFVGYGFSDYMALELAYLNGGNATTESDAVAVGGDLEVETKGLNASILFRARTGSAFAVYGKVGYSQYDFDLVDTLDGAVIAEERISDGAISYGLGLTYTFFEHLMVKFEYEGVNVADGDLNALLLGVGYKF
jgi:opacity protein-like surface antigen